MDRKVHLARTQNEPPSAQYFSIRAKAFDNYIVASEIKTSGKLWIRPEKKLHLVAMSQILVLYRCFGPVLQLCVVTVVLMDASETVHSVWDYPRAVRELPKHNWV